MYYRETYAGFDYYKCGCGENLGVPAKSMPVCPVCETKEMGTPTELVGTALKETIGGFGFKPCAVCHAYAAQLDRRGADWCEEHKQDIVKHLQDQLKQRIWWLPPGTDWTLNKVVDTAIAKARKNANKTTAAQSHATSTGTSNSASVA